MMVMVIALQTRCEVSKASKFNKNTLIVVFILWNRRWSKRRRRRLVHAVPSLAQPHCGRTFPLQVLLIQPANLRNSYQYGAAKGKNLWNVKRWSLERRRSEWKTESWLLKGCQIRKARSYPLIPWS